MNDDELRETAQQYMEVNHDSLVRFLRDADDGELEDVLVEYGRLVVKQTEEKQ